MVISLDKISNHIFIKSWRTLRVSNATHKQMRENCTAKDIIFPPDDVFVHFHAFC